MYGGGSVSNEMNMKISQLTERIPTKSFEIEDNFSEFEDFTEYRID